MYTHICIQVDVRLALGHLMTFTQVRIPLALIVHESTSVSNVKTFELCDTLKKTSWHLIFLNNGIFFNTESFV